MKIFVASSKNTTEFKNEIVEFLKELELDVTTFDGDDEFEAAYWVAKKVQEDCKVNRGILVDAYGSVSFMVVSKFKGIICAQCNDEHSAKMTRSHNNANVITLGSEVVTKQTAKRIVKRFIFSEYSAGRHQIRVDMLQKMLETEGE